MKKLKTIKTEDLVAELKRRKKDVDYKGQIPFCGLVDDNGIESMEEVNASTLGPMYNTLQVRARYNSQRNPEIFFVKMPKMMADVLKSGFGRDEHKEAARQLKGLSNYKKIF